jgi:hypothetical protein
MEKLIAKASYWLGVTCVVLAFLARALNVVGSDSLHFLNKGNPVGYHSFLDGALLFFVMAIATGAYTWVNSTRSGSSRG